MKSAVYLVLFFIVFQSAILTASNKLATNPNNNIETNPEISINIGLVIFPPLIMKEQGGKCFGKTLTDLNKIFASSGIKINIMCASPRRIYREFAANNIDLTINVKTTSSLSKNVVYSTKPYSYLEVMLYKNEDARTKDVSSVSKFEYHGMRKKLTEQAYTFIDQVSSQGAFAVFMRGGTGYLISYKRPFEHYLNEYLQQLSLTAQKITFSEEALISAPTYFAVNTKSKHAKRLLTLLNGL